MPNAIIAVQCTASDLLTSSYQGKQEGGAVLEDAVNYAVGPLRDARVAPVVLAAPDTEQNRDVIPALADRWEVGYFLGDELDTIARLAAAAAQYGAEIVARVVMPSFYVEPGLVRDQLAHLEATGADYCALPRDFNINFGADVVRISALERVADLLDALPPALRGTARYRPWPFLELDEDRHFEIATFEAVPQIPPERVAWIRRQLNWPERSGPGFEGGEYEALADDYIAPDDDVLDAGCGHGEITNIFSKHAASATGVDYDAAMIALARERFPQCSFEAADLRQWSPPKAYDVIFHTHTLEHLPDPVGTLRNLRKALTPGGRLVVEVPLELRPGVINPHHEREYTAGLLLGQLAEAGLSVREERGVCRGIYTRSDAAREAYLAVCTSGDEGAELA